MPGWFGPWKKRQAGSFSPDPEIRTIIFQKQQETLAEAGIGAEWTDSVEQALTLADSFSDPIVILGTTSVISEVEQIFQQS